VYLMGLPVIGRRSQRVSLPVSDRLCGVPDRIAVGGERPSAKIVAGHRVLHAIGLLAAGGRVTTVGDQLPVDLYDSEKERGADAEKQDTVHRFQGADHEEPGRQRQSRYLERRHGGQGIDGRVGE
jgi:hypothetical protein